MSGNHYFKLYTGDYLKDTRHLSVTEHGAYLLLLMQQWDTGPIPNDDATIARILKVRLDVWKKMAPVIRPFFELTPDGRLAQKRLEAERTKIEVLRETRAQVGARGGKAKSLKDKEGRVAIATALPEVCHSPAMPVIVIEDTGELRSPDAVASSDQILPLPEQSASVQISEQGDLLGNPPPAQPEPPTPSKVLFGEGMQKLIDMSGRKRAALASWIGKMRKEGAEDMTILSCIQDAHRRWLVNNTDPANPLEWISGAVKARLKPRGGGPGSNPKREIPVEINGWVVADVVTECNRLMQADGDGLWPGFTALIADSLDAGADPMVHVYPIMSRAKRKGIMSIESLGWFSLSINGARTGVAAA